MNNTELNKIRQQLKQDLKPSRYEHTLGVAYTAAALAMRYRSSMDDAYLAGMLHDCAKYLTDKQSLELLEHSKLKATEVEIANPALLHAKCGVILAKDKYSITDERLLHAILVHTTGCPEMSLLDKIIYIADYIEPNRMEAPNLDEIRRLAFEDIDRCLLKILSDTVVYLKTTGKIIDPTTQETYDYYKACVNA